MAALEASPFALVAQGPALLVLEPLGGVAALRAGSRLAIAEGATLRLEHALGAALPFDGASDEACAGSLFGRWPDAVWWATDRGPKHRGALAQRRGTRWERVKEARVYHSYEALLEVAPDAWVAVVNSNSWCNPEGPPGHDDAPTKRDCGDMPTESLQYFEELPGKRGALPLAPSGALPGAHATPDCRPLCGALAALTTGEIFGAYAGCDSDWGRHAVSLQSNAPNGSRQNASAPLPGVPARNVFRQTLIAVSPSEAYIGLEIGPVYDATTPYLAAFDGRAWREIAPPFARGIESAVRGRDGALWLVAGTHRVPQRTCAGARARAAGALPRVARGAAPLIHARAGDPAPALTSA